MNRYPAFHKVHQTLPIKTIEYPSKPSKPSEEAVIQRLNVNTATNKTLYPLCLLIEKAKIETVQITDIVNKSLSLKDIQIIFLTNKIDLSKITSKLHQELPI